MLVSSTSIISRLAQLAFITLCVSGLLWFFLPHSMSVNTGGRITFPDFTSSHKTPPPPQSKATITVLQNEMHPINHLIISANDKWRAKLSKRTKNVHDAAKAYRARRGRQPPPHFDIWFQYAKENNAIIVEDYFDRIYENLDPFWGVDPRQIRDQANDFLFRIQVRDGKATGRSDDEPREWINLWQDMIQSIAQYLPDVDVPINVMDESRIVAPWEEINDYMTASRASRRIVPDAELKTEYQNLTELDHNPPPHFEPEFTAYGPYWPLVVVGCPPESAARKAKIETDFSKPPPQMNVYPKGSQGGYVGNWSLATSPCENPDLAGLHGTFVEPVSIGHTAKFFPLFGGSKLQMNNEILLPPAMYWSDNPMYSGGKTHGRSWKQKNDQLVWRGAASGGRNKEDNWKRFQRHRFVSMTNATNVRHLEDHPLQRMENFDLPANGTYDLAVHKYGAGETAFSDWVATWADTAFVHLLCFPDNGGKDCDYTGEYFSVEKTMPMKDQYNYKYLPDIDGNSFSGRYRGFLGSTSLPIKATIYQEWHDSRLVPWKHFIPMDNTFIDLFGIMEYFVGNPYVGLEGHDEVAKIIADDGKDWAEKVLRKEDMSIYVLRLLLEYARLCDDDRERMGWAENPVK